MKLLLVLMVGALALGLGAVGAQAGGIPIEGADIGPAHWAPITGGESHTVLQITLHPFSQEGPDTPTTLTDIKPWAVKNFGIDIPFEGSAESFVKPIGIGVSESVKVGTVAQVPVRGGIGYLTGTGVCVFVKSDMISF